MSQTNSNVVSVRYMIDDVDAAVAFYTNHSDFTFELDAAPAFAFVGRGNLRLLLSGEKPPAGNQCMMEPSLCLGGWNRILLCLVRHQGRGRATPRRRGKVPSRRHCVRTGWLADLGG